MHPTGLTPPVSPPSAARAGRFAALPAAAVTVGGAVVFGVAFAWSTSGVVSGPPTCPFRMLTGLPCPACGLTRSWVMLAHGHVGEAFSFNAFGPLFFVIAAIVVLVSGYSLIARRPHVFNSLTKVITSKIALAVLVVWMAYGVLRIADAATGTGWFPVIA